MTTTIVGIVPVGAHYLCGDTSKGEPVVVLCCGCRKPLVEAKGPFWDDHVSSSIYDYFSDGLGSVELGMYGHTDRVYCFCCLAERPDYCNKGQFAICWDPQNSDIGCRGKIDPRDYASKLRFDYKSFSPELEWYEVGVMMLKRNDCDDGNDGNDGNDGDDGNDGNDGNDGDGGDDGEKVFVNSDCNDTVYDGRCLNCHTVAKVSMGYD